jgi:hypothetical protein
MSTQDIVAATVTLARTAAEQALLERSLAGLASLGMPVVAADGGSSPAFVDAIRSIPNLDVVANDGAPGLVGQVRASLTRARSFGTHRILYTEPDKDHFFRERLATFLDRATQEPDAAVVLASRSRQSFSSFPRSQQDAERVLNDVCSAIIGLEADYGYGPFVMAADLADLLDQLPLTVGWGWRPFLFVRSHRLGRRIAHVTGDFHCPDDQQVDDDGERRHRLWQLSQNVAGVAAALD